MPWPGSAGEQGDRHAAVDRPVTEERHNVAGADRACELVRVQFAFDDHRLDDAAKQRLRRDADCLGRRGARVTIAGHADERGGERYNQELGERRARAVASYLESLGLPTTNVNVISFGKERPLCLGHDESCWQQNRRATVRSGGDVASTPREIR